MAEPHASTMDTLRATVQALLPGATFPDVPVLAPIGDTTAGLFHHEIAGLHELTLAGATLATVADISCMATVDGEQLDAEVSATLSLFRGTGHAVDLLLAGEFRMEFTGLGKNRVPVSALSLIATSAASIPVGVLLANVSDALPDELAQFAVGGLRVELHRSAVESVATYRVFAIGRLGGEGLWQVIPGVLALSGPILAVTHEGGRTRLDLAETVELFGTRWAVRVQFPAGVGSATLRSEAPLSMAGFAEHFGLHDPSGTLATLAVSGASVRFDSGTGLLAVSVALDTHWDLGFCRLTEVDFELVHGPGGVSGRATGTWTLGPGTTLRVDAAHPGPGLGWQLAAIGDLGSASAKLPDLLALLGVEAGAVGGLTDVEVTGLSAAYDTLTGAATFNLFGKWLGDPIQLGIGSQRAVPGGKRTYVVAGSIIRAGAILSFQVQSGLFVAGYAGSGSGALSLAKLLAQVEAPAGLDLVVESALLVRGTSLACSLVAADIALAIDAAALQRIPVLGQRLGHDASFGLNVHALYTSGAAPYLAAITSLAPAGVPTLPSSLVDGFGGSRVDLRVGSHSYTLGGYAPGVAASGSPAVAGAVSVPPQVAPTPVHTNLGGVFDLRSVRPSMAGTAIELAVDGSVRFGPVTLDLMGLVIGWDLHTKAPTAPSLRGLSLQLDKPPVRVQGGFLLIDGKGGAPPDFVGKAEITTSRFSLTALGGFTLVGGSPSFFVYGVLSQPLGGPAFFFVEGLAAGFGLNRSLRLPSIDDVETFPLVADAMHGSSAGSGGDELSRLHDYVTPKLGAGFFAAGVKFNSFRLVHGFVLAIVSLDTVTGDFELAVVGTGEWISPPEAPEGARMAYVRLDILAKLSSRDACLMVQAKLGPGCFVINPLCHISGGMALATWYGGEHAGDFVLTVGGYHPAYAVPDHYPVPGRLTIDYRISDGLHATGSLYFALTPNNLMFGFAFSATWATGPLSAWFDLSLDFLMEFKPLHYDAVGHLEIGASVDFWLGSLSVSAGADLHIWGPEFGGHACVHLGPFHGDLSFGAPVAEPPPLTAAEFKAAFLPKLDADLLSIRPAGGLRTTAEGAVWSFNAKEMALSIESLVPLDTALSIPPMTCKGVPVQRKFTLHYVVEKKVAGVWVHEELPGLTPYKPSDPKKPDAQKTLNTPDKLYPPALWKSDIAGARLPSGLRLTAAAATDGSAGPSFSRRALSASGVGGAKLAWANAVAVDADAKPRQRADRAADRASYAYELSRPQRVRDALLDALAKALGDPALQPKLHAGRASPDALLDPPLPATVR